MAAGRRRHEKPSVVAFRAEGDSAPVRRPVGLPVVRRMRRDLYAVSPGNRLRPDIEVALRIRGVCDEIPCR